MVSYCHSHRSKSMARWTHRSKPAVSPQKACTFHTSTITLKSDPERPSSHNIFINFHHIFHNIASGLVRRNTLTQHPSGFGFARASPVRFSERPTSRCPPCHAADPPRCRWSPSRRAAARAENACMEPERTASELSQRRRREVDASNSTEVESLCWVWIGLGVFAFWNLEGARTNSVLQ